MDKQSLVTVASEKTISVKKAATRKPTVIEASTMRSASSQVADKTKAKRSKLVSDSFTMPKTEYQVLSDVKEACLSAGIEIKKSELVRIGIALVSKMSVEKIHAERGRLNDLHIGRQKK